MTEEKRLRKPKFVRRTWNKYSKLGLRRKKKQVWRRPHGRDNKMREKRRGYPQVVSIGWKQNSEEREKLLGKEPVIVNNVRELMKVGKDKIAVVGKVGMKKKIEIARKAKEHGVHIYNLNVNKTLKNLDKKEKAGEKK